ncbi:MAG: NAD-dependent epimerase/dehydratase family protein [Mycobacteriales bacterium]
MSRRALVLGVAGFLGSHLARHLLQRGWAVTGVLADREAPVASRRLAGIGGEVRLVEGDAADAQLLAGLVGGMDAVFPFAGRSGAVVSMTAPQLDLQANGFGQLTVLEAVRRHAPDARLVFPGSRLQYGSARWLPVDEDHPLEPRSIYGVHKCLGEAYHLLYHRLHLINTTSLRISIPYGPGQDRPDAAFGVVGTFLAMAARNRTIPLYGGGTQLRDYLYVGDLVRLVETAAVHPAACGQVFNASGPAATSLADMAASVIRAVGRGSAVAAPWPPPAAAVETGDYVGSWAKAERLLGWRPVVGLAEGLAATWTDFAPMLAAQGVK